MATSLKGTIWGVVFSASPATEIVIPSGYLVNVSMTNVDYITKTITIPSGVKVINVYASCYSRGVDDIISISVSGNKPWLSNDDYYDVATYGYIGVTPNKQYTVEVSADTPYRRVYIDSFYIKYSPEINKQTPDVYDY